MPDWNWNFVIGPAAGATISGLIALFIHLYNRRHIKASILEQSFNALQRINEAALRSDANLVAAIKSVAYEEEVNVERARIYYFNYLRINRLYRAYEYWQNGLISKKTAMRIIHSHLSSVKEAEPYLDRLLERGYPKDFYLFLERELQSVTSAPHISTTPAKLATAPDQSNAMTMPS